MNIRDLFMNLKKSIIKISVPNIYMYISKSSLLKMIYAHYCILNNMLLT